MAYATSLVLVQAIIALVGLATALGNGEVSKVIVRTLQAAVPGPAGRLLTDAVDAGASGRRDAPLRRPRSSGSSARSITGSTLFGQLERGLNRIYGVEQDRPTLQKYGLALLSHRHGGLLVSVAFAALAFGRTIGDSIHNDALSTVVGDRPLAARARRR